MFRLNFFTSTISHLYYQPYVLTWKIPN